uniref:Uncharacterized protein n=1 Tax=Plectus sambesii TaxID=2011161 RepID=A0A914WBZ8_9BILA
MSAEPCSSSTGPTISLLTPNESRRIVREEQHRRRIARLVQVRIQAKRESARIRQRVQERKQIELTRAKHELAEKLREEKQKTVLSLKQQLHDSRREAQKQRTSSEWQDRQEGFMKTKSKRQQHEEAVRRHAEALRAVRSAEERQKAQSLQQLLQKRRAVAEANARSRRKLPTRPVASNACETSLSTEAHDPYPPRSSALDRLERAI